MKERNILISDEQDYPTINAATVYDRDGHKIGPVGQLYFDNETNRPIWVTVNTGFFGTRESFIPLEDATFTGDRLQVPYEKAFIKKSPIIESGGAPTLGEEKELYRYYRLAHHDEVQQDIALEPEQVRDDAATMTAAEERLNVGTEQVEAGRARLRKHVTTEQQTITVPVEKEILTVEREAVAGDTRRDRITGDEEREDIVLREERPVVSKEVHETERVTVGKETVTESEQVRGDIQKEHIEVEQEGNYPDDDRRI